MSVHEGVKYHCNQCEFKASQKGDLKKHKMSVHVGDKYQGDLKRHEMSVHEGVKYQCSQCA